MANHYKRGGIKKMKSEYIWNRQGEIWRPGNYRDPYSISVKCSEKKFVEYLEEKITEAIREYKK